jgi:glycosyltransferase involved in cell wall biosynthesis
MESIPQGIGGEAASLVSVSDAIHPGAISASHRANKSFVGRRSAPARKSILIYSPQFNTIGGVETHLVRVSCFLAQRDCQVTLVTTSGMLEASRVAELSAAGVEFIAPAGGQTLSVFRKAMWLVWLTATRLRRQHWDVVYTNAQGSLSWLLRPLKQNGTRLLHHYHTAGDERDQRTWSWLFPKWLRAVDEIVACSTSTAQNLRRALGVSCSTDQHGRDKIRVIRYLSADIDVPADRARPAPDAKLRFGFVGRLMRDKGLDMICRLSQDPDLKDIEWHIHGCGPHYDAAYFKAYPNTHYHGRYQGAAELGAILEGLDGLALFSTYQEGQPISLIEGMAAGLPWIATDQGGTRELMWSPSNCRLIDAACDYSDAKRAVADLANAIREGKTSFSTQRRAYDDHLAASAVGERWIEFLTEEAPQALEGAWVPGAIR